MKQKKWKNCPACGTKGSMSFKKRIYQIFESKNYPAVKIGPLSESICTECREGIYTIRSLNFIEEKLTEHKARYDSKTTVVDDVVNVSDASKVLRMTRQGVIQLMKRGKLPYVFFGKMRIPKREGVIKYSSAHRY